MRERVRRRGSGENKTRISSSDLISRSLGGVIGQQRGF